MTFLLLGCVIFGEERLHDFFVWRGCMIFPTQFFVWRGCMIFLWRGCVIFFVERLRDFVCGDVA